MHFKCMNFALTQCLFFKRFVSTACFQLQIHCERGVCVRACVPVLKHQVELLKS